MCHSSLSHWHHFWVSGRGSIGHIANPRANKGRDYSPPFRPDIVALYEHATRVSSKESYVVVSSSEMR